MIIDSTQRRLKAGWAFARKYIICCGAAQFASAPSHHSTPLHTTQASNSVSEQAVNEAYDIAQALFDAIKPDLSEDPKLHSRISLIEKLYDAFENHEHSMLDRCLEELDTCDLTAQVSGMVPLARRGHCVQGPLQRALSLRQLR